MQKLNELQMLKDNLVGLIVHDIKQSFDDHKH